MDFWLPGVDHSRSVEGHSFTALLVVVGAAMVTGILLPRVTILRIPLVVGEILIGIVLGKSGFRIIPEQSDPWLELLSLFGFAFLMFLSGLEIDMRALSVGGAKSQASKKPNRSLRRLMTMTFSIFGLTLVTSLILSWGLVFFGYLESPYIMSLIMSTTSVGLVMPLLKERGEGGTPFGQTVILSAVVADFVTMLLITVVVAGYEEEGATLDVLVVGTLFILFFALLFAGRWLLTKQKRLVKHLAFTAPKTAEVPVRVAMTLMLGFVVFSEVIGSEIILGAFLAGTAISSLSRRSVHGLLGMKLDAIGFGFFIPIFFIMVGARFDIHSLREDPASLALVPILVAFAFLVKVIPNLLLSRYYGRRNAIAAGFLLSSRLSLVIAASEIGLRLGAITPEINTAIIMVAIITCVFSPAIYARMRPKTQKKAKEAVHLDQLIGHHVQKTESSTLELQLVEVEAVFFPFACDKSLRDSRLRNRTGLTLIAVARADGTLVDNPPADFELSAGDALFMVGTEEQVENMERVGMARLSTVPPPPTPES